VWSAALIMFFGLLRRANVLATSQRGMDKCIKRSDIIFYDWGIQITVNKTKTIQYQERALQLPLPRLKDSIFCPAQALFHAMQQNQQAPMDGSAYVLRNGQLLTTNMFVKQIRHCLQALNLPAKQYGGHSFRRGGASWAYQVGIPVETIRQLGDWKSLAYMDYIHVNKQTLFNAVRQMQCKLHN
jgi:integrase